MRPEWNGDTDEGEIHKGRPMKREGRARFQKVIRRRMMREEYRKAERKSVVDGNGSGVLTSPFATCV